MPGTVYQQSVNVFVRRMLGACCSKPATRPYYPGMPDTRSEKTAGDVERLDVTQLGWLLRERRGTQSLRKAAAAAGVSFSTMARVEEGAQPDLASFTRLCAWLGLPPSRFFTPVTERTREPLEEVLSHLQADPRLTPHAATAISGVLKEMYAALAAAPKPEASPVACHLRAAPVMRPGVPRRLGSLLSEIHRALDDLVARNAL